MAQPKVSAGALRAASEINHGWVEGIHGMAEIIDRETGVGELLEAARGALQLVDFIFYEAEDGTWIGSNRYPQMSRKLRPKLEQAIRNVKAIAKCEGKK
ncbi:hypothetical protein LCGC14_2663220 [marine sediment metagenome]|uniref:Uncharacterized protein n=1 Tax=marine sediment metagenome TaxID=412755 RepID=A0A0F8ZRD5_9ZZZZ